ncbi:ECF transporter S component [Williamsoniiplasma lucivorax]|uniref:Uncharacterized protein n=1 Tax=Williamsoniiplasma lucivorax TaxID=209274 RepID=A0A2S5RD56_9MOLU|nr:ECF transporter S component [Williamsoniiplasma lucivorax]PPE05266.1 hypothetical protein ELUCI_v1c08020 [Williamsoniiplasma lucivorax]
MKKDYKDYQSQQNVIWGYKLDTAEINKRNRKIIIRNYFALPVKKISLIAMILALNVVVSIFSKFVNFHFWFFVLEVSFFTILIFLFFSNLFYTIIFIQIATWFRVLFGDEWVGLLAMDLIDCFFITLTATILFWAKFVMVRLQTSNILSKIFWVQIPLLILIILITAGFGTLLNWWFLLSAYKVPVETRAGYLPIIFGLNIAKYAINVFIFILIYKPVLLLIKNYRL